MLFIIIIKGKGTGTEGSCLLNEKITQYQRSTAVYYISLEQLSDDNCSLDNYIKNWNFENFRIV